jgi:hypothetical protein
MANDPLDIEGCNEWWGRENAKQETHFQRLFCLIGKATAAFAHLEWQLNQSFALAVNHRHPEFGLRIADTLSYAKTIDAFEAVCRDIVSKMRPEISQQLSDLGNKLRAAGNLRNAVAHSSFDYVIGSDGQFLQIRSRVRSKKKNRERPMSDPFPGLEQAYSTICETQQELLDFTEEYL